MSAANSLWIKCRNCGFRTICSHVREKLLRIPSCLVRRDSYAPDEIRCPVLGISRARLGESNSYSYFCWTCGEHLADLIDEDRTAEILGRFGDMDPVANFDLVGDHVRYDCDPIPVPRGLSADGLFSRGRYRISAGDGS